MTPQEQWLQQKELRIAWLRAGFALVALVVIQLNPRRVAHDPTLSYFALGSFLAYSFAALYLTRSGRLNSRLIGITTTILDLVWVSWIAFATEGSRTPFFAYYMFPIISASSRYGIKGGVAVALAGAMLYGFIRFHFVWERPLGLDTFAVRAIYLVGLAYVFGFLSEFENNQNRKLLALSATAADVATVEERRRIMREIHDGLLQSLATHILRLESCRQRLLGSPEELAAEIRSIEDETRGMMKEIRRFLAGKETQAFPPGMFIEKLKGDLSFLRDRLGVRVILETDPEDFSLPAEIEQDVYYVLREALTNVTRHSQASRTDIRLKRAGASLQAELSDDGVGFDPQFKNSDQGLGMTTMRQRVSKYGGELNVESAPGKGTRVSFTLPLNGARAHA